jgi:hypothetical protein
MRKSTLLAAVVALTAITAVPRTASAQSNRTLTGAAIGAGSGALIAGPPGAVVGGVVGGIVGGPSHSRPFVQELLARQLWRSPLQMAVATQKNECDLASAVLTKVSLEHQSSIRR